MNCNNCGKPNPRSAKICPDCGYMLGKKQPVIRRSQYTSKEVPAERKIQKQGSASVLVSLFVSVTLFTIGVFFVLNA